MRSPTIRRSLLGPSRSIRRLNSRTTSPLRRRLTTVSHTLEPTDVPSPLINSGTRLAKPPSSAKTPLSKRSPPGLKPRKHADIIVQNPSLAHLLKQSSNLKPRHAHSKPLSPPSALQLSTSTKTLLPLLTSQPPHYITAHIYDKPYLLTAGDVLRLPFLMHGVTPGDTLRLNRASVLGSREYTLKAGNAASGAVAALLRHKGVLHGLGGGKRDAPFLDERLFVCRARVLGAESEPMRVMEKTKRRQRHVKHVRSKHRYTLLRITELKVHRVEDLLGEEEAVGEVAVSEREKA